MIQAILVFNEHGKPRLSKFYTETEDRRQQEVIQEVFRMVSRRGPNSCNFLEGGTECSIVGTDDTKLVYRQYATLFFVFAVDSSESELGILDLIQVFVETLDRRFQNVCELDIHNNVSDIHHMLDEMVMGGMVLETSMQEVLTHTEAQEKLLKSEGRWTPGG